MIRPSLICLMIALACGVSCSHFAPASRAGTCAPLTSGHKAALARYVQRKYRLGDEPPLAVTEVSNVDGCYRRLRFTGTGTRRFRASLFLTPDQRYLVSDLSDSTVDPMAGQIAQVASRGDLEKEDGRPSLGPADAPVTIVVFSDFECPYCANFAGTIRQVAAEDNKVRVVFRNMPLEFHPWARRAAETAACVQAQSGEAFWRVHDYLFAHQRELTAENLDRNLMGFIGTLPAVRADLVRNCLDKGAALPRIQRDMALAAASDVRGTPTVFVNGRALSSGAPNREYLLTVIRETQDGVLSARLAGRPKAGQ
jgi:protein-disulfide isomerase